MKMAMANPMATTAIPAAIKICESIPDDAVEVGGGEVVGGGVVGWLDTRTLIPNAASI